MIFHYYAYYSCYITYRTLCYVAKIYTMQRNVLMLQMSL